MSSNEGADKVNPKPGGETRVRMTTGVMARCIVPVWNPGTSQKVLGLNPLVCR